MLLAWRFQRSRIAAALLALALLERGLAYRPELATPLAVDAVSMVLPLVMLGLVLPEDRGVTSPRGAALWAGVILAAGGLALLLRAAPDRVADFLGRSVVDPRLSLWGGVPEVAAASFAAAATVITVQAIRRRRPVEEGFLWALVAMILAFTTAAGSHAFSGWLTTAGLILALAVVEASHAMAYHDDLTGLPARRAFRSALDEAGGLLTVAVVDVDHFKRFNDRHGHAVGDQVLRMVAGRLDRVGGGGRAYRTGGEEFTLLFPGRRKEEVLPHLDALLVTVATSRFNLRGRDRRPGSRGRARRGRSRGAAAGPLSVTVSIGVAQGEGGPAGEDTVKAADRALYRAKRAGRNRVGR
jgi:GGDEF domain-containing protein